MPEQLQLTLTRALPEDPGVADLERWFEEQSTWKSAHEIAAETGWNDRKIRDLASASDLIISSPGRKGYRHIRHVTSDEYHAYRNGRRSQCRLMLAKVIRTDRIFYRRPPVTP